MLLGLSVFLMSTACAGQSAREPTTPTAATAADARAHAGPPADEQREKRTRDVSPAEGRADDVDDRRVSPLAQSNDEIDLDLTQRIRRQLIDDDRLSFSAKNVQIVTEDGIVTLAGAVKSKAEAEEVRQKALAEAGPGRVRDQLEVRE